MLPKGRETAGIKCLLFKLCWQLQWVSESNISSWHTVRLVNQISAAGILYDDVPHSPDPPPTSTLPLTQSSSLTSTYMSGIPTTYPSGLSSAHTGLHCEVLV